MGVAPSTALVAVPSVTVALVSLALLVVGAPQPALGARIYGGPTRGAGVLAWRIATATSMGGVEEPVKGARLRVEAELRDGRVVSTSGVTDAEGLLDVVLALGDSAVKAPIVARIRSEAPTPKPPLAQGSVDLAPQAWAQAVRRRGGPSTYRRQDYSLTVAARRGVLAVPFEDELELELRRGQLPVASAALYLSANGLQLLGEQKLSTDAAGRARLRVRPTFHQVTLEVKMKPPGGPAQEAATPPPESTMQYWALELPVVPGALLGEADELSDRLRLRVTSPVARERAYLGLVDEQQRFSGTSLNLSPSAGGMATGEIFVHKPTSSRLWLVVSSDADERNPSTVGWPVWGVQPAETFDAPLALLLDGMPAARAREARRQRRAQYVAAAVAVTGLLTASVFMLMLHQQSRAPVLDEMLADLEHKRQSFSSTSLWWAIFGVFVVSCGFALLALFALYRS